MQARDLQRALTKNTKVAIKRSELTIEQISKKPHSVSARTIRRIKSPGNKVYAPRLTTLVKLSNSLGVSLDQLISIKKTTAPVAKLGFAKSPIKTGAIPSAWPFPTHQ